MLYQDMGKNNEALVYLEKCLQLREKVGIIY
jgi:hypothetical protein